MSEFLNLSISNVLEKYTSYGYACDPKFNLWAIKFSKKIYIVNEPT